MNLRLLVLALGTFAIGTGRVVQQPAVVAALSLTAIGLGAGFVVFTYIGPLMGELTGYGGRGTSGMLLLFGLAAIVGITPLEVTVPTAGATGGVCP